MNKTFFITKLVPVITIALCTILYLSGYFQIIFAAILVLIASLGFQRHRINVKSLLIMAPLFGITFFLFYYYVMVPSVNYLTGQPIDYSFFEPYVGNLPATLGLLVFVWISAAFGEEIVFRGYLMQQFTKFFGFYTCLSRIKRTDCCRNFWRIICYYFSYS